MAPTKGGVAKQIQNQSRTAATPVYNHDGTNIVITPSSTSSSRQHYSHLNIPVGNVPPGISRNDGFDSPFTQFTQQQQSPFSSNMNTGMNPNMFHSHHQQQGHFNGTDPLSASSAPTPTPTPGPASMNAHGFQGGYYNNNNNNMRQMVNPNNFYPNGAGAHTGSLGPMFGNGMQSPEPFGPQSMQQQQGQYGMPMNYNMGFGFQQQQQQQQQQNQQSFNMNGNMMYMLPVSPTSNADFNSNYEPPSTSSSDTPPDRDFSVSGDGMDMELEVDTVDMLSGGSYGLLSPSTEMLTSPSSDRTGTENGTGLDTVVKGEDFGTNSSALSPPLIGEAKSVNGTPTLSTLSKTSSVSSTGTPINNKSSLPSSKEKEQNKQKLYRNRKSEFTNKMRDELLGMGMLPSTRVTHAPEIMSKTADTLRDYRELLELIQNKIEGMPANISSVPGAVKKLLNENGNLFNNIRQVPQQQQTQQQQQPTHTFKPDIKVPLGNMNGTTTNPLTGRVTRSGAHVF